MKTYSSVIASNLRPVLSSVQAEEFNRQEVLKFTGAIGNETLDRWDPIAQGFGKTWENCTADYVVGPSHCADGIKVFASVQAAIDQAVRSYATAKGRGRIYIEVLPGRYTGLIYVPRFGTERSPVAITLFSRAAEASETHLSANIDAEMTGEEYSRTFGPGFVVAPPEVRQIFTGIAQRDKITTANASVLRVENHGFVLANLSIQNSYNADRAPTTGLAEDDMRNSAGQFVTGQHQAVAALIAGADRVYFETVRLASFQDTLYVKSPGPGQTNRACFNKCYIEGDVDFIFGQAIAFFQSCEIKSLGVRAGQSWVTAPSTNLHSKFGFVFDDCDFTHDDGATCQRGLISLGRQWFEAVRATPYGQSPIEGYSCRLGDNSTFTPPIGSISRETLFAVGKSVVMNSRIGDHINPAAPWGDWCGGSYTREGTYDRGTWHSRFRPAQNSGADFLRNLAAWSNTADLDMSTVTADQIFLAEYNNQTLA